MRVLICITNIENKKVHNLTQLIHDLMYNVMCA